MLDIDSELWPEYYRLLNGNVLLKGQPVPVFDAFMSLTYDTSQDYAAIIWNQSSTLPRPGGCNFEGSISATIEVTCGYREVMSYQECDSLVNQVEQILIPFNVRGVYNLPSFQILNATLQGTNRLDGFTATHYEYRRLLRINHIYLQKVIA